MIEKQVREMIAYQLCLHPDDISLTDSLADYISLDSLDVMEIVMEAEERFNIEIPDDSIYDLVTVGDVVNIVTELVGERE